MSKHPSTHAFIYHYRFRSRLYPTLASCSLSLRVPCRRPPPYRPSSTINHSDYSFINHFIHPPSIYPSFNFSFIHPPTIHTSPNSFINQTIRSSVYSIIHFSIFIHSPVYFHYQSSFHPQLHPSIPKAILPFTNSSIHL